MDPSALALAGLPGMPTPQTCKECPPWDPDCGKTKTYGAAGGGGLGLPCFSNDECDNGQYCGDSGYCEGGDLMDMGDGSSSGKLKAPKVFYFNVTIGSGGGIISAPNSSYYAAEYYSNPKNMWATNYTSMSGASWGGLGLRATMGFNINPKFALEIGGRFDLSSAWMKQKNPYLCNDSTTAPSSTLICSRPHAQPPVYGVYYYISNANEYIVPYYYTTAANKAWLINLKGRFRFVNDGGLQASFFGGIGYGHLFFAPKSTDVDLDGAPDTIIVTPGAVNIELGPGFAYYFNRNVGFVMDVPIDLVFGENSSFGINGEITIGLSFGG
jgi:hypothetical protein